MNFEEWKVLAKGLRTVYTAQNFLPDADALRLWFELIKDIDYETAQTAIKKYMLTNRFPPTIADIRACSTELTVTFNDWNTEWENVLNAVRKFGSYHPKEAVESLGDITRECVKTIGFLNICMNEETRFRKEFRDLYETYSQRAKTNAQLPETLKAQIGALSERLQIGAKDD